jgi:hypothetical protein
MEFINMPGNEHEILADARRMLGSAATACLAAERSGFHDLRIPGHRANTATPAQPT